MRVTLPARRRVAARDPEQLADKRITHSRSTVELAPNNPATQQLPASSTSIATARSALARGFAMAAPV